MMSSSFTTSSSAETQQQQQQPLTTHDVQRAIHYVISLAESVHLPPLDIETIKQVLLTKMMIGNNKKTDTSTNSLVISSGNDDFDDGHHSSVSHGNSNEDVALAAARRIQADADRRQNGMDDDDEDQLSPEEKCHEMCEKVADKLQNHKRATLRAIAAARNYDAAWANLVPAIKRFEISLPLEDIHSMEGKMVITEHISRCVLAMKAVSMWQASAVHLVEAIVLWRSELNRPFPFSLDGHCNLLLRVACDAAAIKSSPIPHALLIGGSGVDLEQVVIPNFFSHLPSLCEFAMISASSSTTNDEESMSYFSTMSPQSLFGFGGTRTNTMATTSTTNSSVDQDQHSTTTVSVSGEDDLIRSLARRWERRVIGMHFASQQDATNWALEAAEDVVASYAGLPGRRGQLQENYLKRVRTAEYTISLEHNTHWGLLKELLTLCATEGKHIPLLNLPGVVEPKGGEDGVVIDCPHLMENLYRTIVSAIESLNGLTTGDDGSGGENDDASFHDNDADVENESTNNRPTQQQNNQRRQKPQRPASAGTNKSSSRISTASSSSTKPSTKSTRKKDGGNVTASYGGYGSGGIQL